MPPVDLLLELTRRYTEPHRHYHTIEHIAQMLAWGAETGLSDGQVWAVWFHDAVCDPRSDTNEADSAALAVERLGGAGCDPALIARVEQMVLDTVHHEPSIPDSKLVLDLDLGSLASPWEGFEHNRQRIREEYAHAGEAEYRQGTRAFLERFLARERIYFTDWGAPREERARANLERLLAEIG